MRKSSESRGFETMFSPGRLTLGVFFPIEAFQGDEPTMRGQERLARRAEELGFAALWFRDVPLRDPNFGDVGQVYDPWVYLGWIAAQTRTIALATGSIVLPLRHPLHTAKASASVDKLSGGRLVLGVASGDRPVEFPAFGVDYERRDVLFRENFRVIREVLTQEFPRIRSSYGTLFGTADLVPKPDRPAADPGDRFQPAEHGMDRRAFRRLDHLSAFPRQSGGARRALARRRGGRGTRRVQAVRAVILHRPDR